MKTNVCSGEAALDEIVVVAAFMIVAIIVVGHRERMVCREFEVELVIEVESVS